MGASAVRRTTTNNGIHNGKGQGQVYEMEQIMESDRNAPSIGKKKGQMRSLPLCVRCRSPGHFWRQCTMPFRKDLDFGTGSSSIEPKPRASNRNRDDLRGTLLTMAENILLESEIMGIPIPDETEDIPEGNDAVEKGEEGKAYLCRVSNIYRVKSQVGPNVCTSVVIESGASTTVCSMGFIKFLAPQIWGDRMVREKKFLF